MPEMSDAPEQNSLVSTSDDPLEKMPQAQRLRWLARATHRAMAGSRRVQSEEDWGRLLAEAHQEYDSGAFLLERFFSIPGIGREVILAVERSDFPVIKALTVYVAVATMVVNLLADLMYKAVDPRVQLR